MHRLGLLMLVHIVAVDDQTFTSGFESFVSRKTIGDKRYCCVDSRASEPGIVLSLIFFWGLFVDSPVIVVIKV